MRSVSLDMSVSPQQQYPIRASSPYALMQQQQQQGMGSPGMMPNQAGMVNAGRSNSLLLFLTVGLNVAAVFPQSVSVGN